MRRCACRHRQARSCACVRCSVRDGVRARRHTADASKASRQSHLTASPVYESSEGGEESAYDDRMSLEHLCATCRAAHAHARRASDHSCEPAAASSPCTCSSLGGGRRWSFPRSPHRCSSPGCARRWRRPRSPCRRSSVGSARVLDLKQLGSVELERVLGFLDLQAQRRNELQTLLVLSSCSFLNLEAIKLRLQVGTASLPPPWPRCPLRWRQQYIL